MDGLAGLRAALALTAAGALTACGADGEPVPPAPRGAPSATEPAAAPPVEVTDPDGTQEVAE
ncbi:hypothetical protein [Roseivivax marinus]|uniref:hypothetical protein n=1 Tax=Roseivivax marinus TaxID=1379903 RepID=UPI00273D2810|nr:hypothetical protein [Roseivivax marinus]